MKAPNCFVDVDVVAARVERHSEGGLPLRHDFPEYLGEKAFGAEAPTVCGRKPDDPSARGPESVSASPIALPGARQRSQEREEVRRLRKKNYELPARTRS